MAGGRNDTFSGAHPPQHAGVKRTHAQERLPPRKSARLEKLYQDKPAPAGGHVEIHRDDSNSNASRVVKRTQPGFRRRPRTHTDRTTLEEPFDKHRKRRRGTAEESALIPASRGDPSEDDEHPISYWAANKQWPRQCFENGKDMEHILARKRSISSRSRKNSDTDSATPSSTNRGEQKSREQKSSEYKKPQYATVLATRGVFMKSSSLGVMNASQDWCTKLLEQQQAYPHDTLFRDNLFSSTCESVQDKNETRVIRDIALLIVPSAEVFAIRGATHLQCLIESVNEGWNNSIAITKTRPQPDFAAGFRREAFTQEQLDRMHPVVGDFNDQSYFMATWYMYFPFLTCEVKCGAAALDIADRQNAHSAAIAVRAVVELFRAVKREKEVHREILAFSISHDHCSARIYGYYAEVNGAETKYYRHMIRNFVFTELGGKEKWTVYQFTKNVYDHWMPKHFERICSAIDEIPADISFSISQSELRFSRTSELSQDLSTHSIAQSSDTAYEQAQDDTQSSISQYPVATPSTSVHEGAPLKMPRKGHARRGRK